MVAERAQAICHMAVGETLPEAVTCTRVTAQRRRSGLTVQAREKSAVDVSLAVRDQPADAAKLLEDS
jgi:hypothetical protein